MRIEWDDNAVDVARAFESLVYGIGGDRGSGSPLHLRFELIDPVVWHVVMDDVWRTHETIRRLVVKQLNPCVHVKQTETVDVVDD